MKRKSFLALITPLALGVAYLTAPQMASAQTNIVVGADTTFPPFETEVDGNVTGFDIDMIKAVAKAEGLTVTIKTLPFNGIIPSLQTGALDAAVAGITIKTSRLQNVDFSDAYYKSGLSILVKKGSGITGFDDLKGHVVATKKATSSVDYLAQHGFDMGYVKQFQDIDFSVSVTGDRWCGRGDFRQPRERQFQDGAYQYRDCRAAADRRILRYRGEQERPGSGCQDQ